jgi:hypothetical protein
LAVPSLLQPGGQDFIGGILADRAAHWKNGCHGRTLTFFPFQKKRIEDHRGLRRVAREQLSEQDQE